MNVIQLDNDGLKAFVQETIRQALAANAAIECETGVTIAPRFKVAFSGVVVAKGGLNALKRKTVDSSADQSSTTIDEPYTEVSRKVGKQSSKSAETSTVNATENQDGTNNQTGEGTQKRTSTDERKSVTTATDKSDSKSDSASKEDSKAEHLDHTSQSQANGTRQVTTTEYSR